MAYPPVIKSGWAILSHFDDFPRSKPRLNSVIFIAMFDWRVLAPQFFLAIDDCINPNINDDDI